MNLILLVTFQLIFGAPCLAFFQGVSFSSSYVSPVRRHTHVAAEKAARDITGEDLEVMLTEWDQPLVLDAYATWCGPCLLMAPEFEAAAKQLQGRVRFAKMDTDKESEMAGRLNIMGLPTLLFLDRFQPQPGQEDTGPSKAVLKERIEGAIRKDSIIALCEHHFFGAPRPDYV